MSTTKDKGPSPQRLRDEAYPAGLVRSPSLIPVRGRVSSSGPDVGSSPSFKPRPLAGVRFSGQVRVSDSGSGPSLWLQHLGLVQVCDPGSSPDPRLWCQSRSQAPGSSPDPGLPFRPRPLSWVKVRTPAQALGPELRAPGPVPCSGPESAIEPSFARWSKPGPAKILRRFGEASQHGSSPSRPLVSWGPDRYEWFRMISSPAEEARLFPARFKEIRPRSKI